MAAQPGRYLAPKLTVIRLQSQQQWCPTSPHFFLRKRCCLCAGKRRHKTAAGSAQRSRSESRSKATATETPAEPQHRRHRWLPPWWWAENGHGIPAAAESQSESLPSPEQQQSATTKPHPATEQQQPAAAATTESQPAVVQSAAEKAQVLIVHLSTLNGQCGLFPEMFTSVALSNTSSSTWFSRETCTSVNFTVNFELSVNSKHAVEISRKKKVHK